MRCLGWRFSYNHGKWSCLYSCEVRWRPNNFHLTWVQVWEDEVWVVCNGPYYSHYYTRVDE